MIAGRQALDFEEPSFIVCKSTEPLYGLPHVQDEAVHLEVG